MGQQRLDGVLRLNGRDEYGFVLFGRDHHARADGDAHVSRLLGAE